jgi:hypothetical protein
MLVHTFQTTRIRASAGRRYYARRHERQREFLFFKTTSELGGTRGGPLDYPGTLYNLCAAANPSAILAIALLAGKFSAVRTGEELK